MRDFEVRFGRRPRAMWLPETAVDLATLRVLADAGIEATILAPWQADVPAVDTRRPYRVDVGDGKHVTVALYDGDVSGAVSFDSARDGGRRPLRARAHRAPPGRRALVGGRRATRPRS